MQQFKAKIVLNKKIAPDHYLLSFKAPKIAKNTKPGQFFNIRVTSSCQPLLRRPFGAHKIGKNRIEILYKVVGRATGILSQKIRGDVLDIIGPLGNGFDSKLSTIHYPLSAILVAGGHGVAPLYALGSVIASPDRRSGRSNLTAFLGARTKKHIVCDKDLQKLGAKVYVATEDGSRGYKGLVTDLLKKTLFHLAGGIGVPPGRWNRVRSTMYACGPRSMLKEIAKLAKRYKIPCQVSLEEYIACGIGTCLGCAVKTRAGYKMVCKDGPVFDAKEITW